MGSLSELNHTAQQQAAGLHAQLSKLLAPPRRPADSAIDSTTDPYQQQQVASQHLLSLALANTALSRALTAPSSKQQQPGTAEEQEEVQEACSRREQLLDDLLQLLDGSSQALRDQLDSCHKLLDTKPCMEEPERIIRYAHTLRYGYAPLGTTPMLWQVPPAPQIPYMLHSTLRQYHMELASQQQQDGAQPAQQQQQDGAQPAQQQQQQQAVLPPQGVPGATLQQPDGAAAQQQQQQEPVPMQQPVPLAISFQLNQDLEDDEELETASEEEMSEEDYSDD
jgi:hypothetical protein